MKKMVLFRMCLVALIASLTLVATVNAQSGGQKLVEGLKVYNSQLAKQIAAQEQAKKDITTAIGASRHLRPQLVMQMQKMLADLKNFVKSDLPFHKDDRMSGLGQLEALMVDADASDSDRLRNILDVYTIESEYGNSTEAYSDTVSIDGNDIDVDMLRVGRLALYYQTKDSKLSGMWDKKSNAWVALPEGMNRHLRKAIKVAAKQIAPELLKLPINAPEAV